MSSIDGFYPVSPSYIVHRTSNEHRRANPSTIYAHPLPLAVHDFPPLIPSNPLSVLYFTYTYVSQYLFPPTSHSPRITGYYSPVTNSIHVTDPTSIRLLWERGFFGKGSLSRSEPSWLDREMQRRGLQAKDTSEVVTRRRREERKKFKNERAKREREIIEERLMEELLVDKVAKGALRFSNDPVSVQAEKSPGQPTWRSKYEGVAETAFLNVAKKQDTQVAAAEVDEKSRDRGQSLDLSNPNCSTKRSAPKISSSPRDVQQQHEQGEIFNQEHLQLTPEEAFFLAYALGILDVYPESQDQDPLDPTIPAQSLLSPKKALTSASLITSFTTHSFSPPPFESDDFLKPDSPFLLSYVTYHHFRSLGWVVRPGVKFGTDWLLYLRGPVFSHAEFAVTILPAYTHEYWLGSDAKKAQTRDWHWLHCVQRVQSQVRKTLIICWVDVPPPSAIDADESHHGDPDIAGFLKQYKVREMVMKRWIPNRSRD